MRLFFLTALTMTAFAANSVLNRFALAEGQIGPSTFALVRLVSGALALAAMVWWVQEKERRRFEVSPISVGALALYVLGFSFAYVSLEAGTGALILFGGVQITMFAGALITGERVSVFRWLGAGLAFAGLSYLLLPSAGAPSSVGAALMGFAALGWGIYSLLGRSVSNPLGATAANFVLAIPAGILVWFLVDDTVAPSAAGVVLACVSGVVTSGLGYALWYSILPQLDRTVAAIAQLTVPVIALAGGMIFVQEAASPAFLLATLMVLGGVAVSLVPGKKSTGKP